MTDDLITRAENALAYDSWVGHPAAAALLQELVAALKAAQEENERLRGDAEMWRGVQSMYRGMR